MRPSSSCVRALASSSSLFVALLAYADSSHVLFSPPSPYGDCANSTNWTSSLLDIHAQLNLSKAFYRSQAPGKILFGGHFLFNLLNCDTPTLTTTIGKLLAAAVTTRTPILIGLDPQVWWEKSGLWNWFDPLRPGYDPSNIENVESTQNQTKLKISWLNWGRQMRMMPAQNIHAPRVMEASHKALRAVSLRIARWYAAATPEERGLLAGVKLGCEAAIGWQTWDYPHANSYYEKWPRNDSNDPKYGVNHSAAKDPPTWGMQQIGFSAAEAAGVELAATATAAPALTNSHVSLLTQLYLRNLTTVAVAAGVPTTVLFTHLGGTLVPHTDELAPTIPYATGILPDFPEVGLGVSLYVTPLQLVPSFARALDAASTSTGWGAVEFGLGNFWAPTGDKPGTTAAWLAAMASTLDFHDCRLISQVPVIGNAGEAARQLLETRAQAYV